MNLPYVQKEYHASRYALFPFPSVQVKPNCIILIRLIHLISSYWSKIYMLTSSTTSCCPKYMMYQKVSCDELVLALIENSSATVPGRTWGNPHLFNSGLINSKYCSKATLHWPHGCLNLN